MELTTRCRWLMGLALKGLPEATTAPPEERWVAFVRGLPATVVEVAWGGAVGALTGHPNEWTPMAEWLTVSARGLLYEEGQEWTVRVDRATIAAGLPGVEVALGGECLRRYRVFDEVWLPPNPWGSDCKVLGCAGPNPLVVLSIENPALSALAHVMLGHYQAGRPALRV